jgi:Ca2+-binding RTX toxin-like protein
VGAVALYASVFPNATSAQIREALLQSATFTTSLEDRVASDGRLDIAAMLAIAPMATEFADWLEGTDGADTLNGLGGNDTLAGGDGNDLIQGGSGDDLISYAELTAAGQAVSVNLAAGRAAGAAGHDTLSGMEHALTGAGNDILIGDGLANRLSGGAGEDRLMGGDGHDTLDGGTGADTMWGGFGDDVYIVGEGDVFREAGGQGTDLILLRRAALSLTGQHIENVTGDMAGLAFSITGNSLANMLTGGVLADTLDGGSNHDTLAGGAGNDRLIGGSGNDLLDGGTGADTMWGGFGNDVYIVGEGDVFREAGGQGADLILLRRAALSLAGQHIENVTGDMAGLAFSITGNSLANMLTGGALADTLNGGSNHDTLAGGAGNDCLIGGSGNDNFIFNTALSDSNIDILRGFEASHDTILLDDAVFTAIGSPGSLAAGAFTTGMMATDQDHRIIHHSATHALFYDADGLGDTAAVQFATLAGVSGVITHADFLII